MASRRAGVGGQIKSSRTPAHNTAIVFSVGVIYRTELGTRLWALSNCGSLRKVNNHCTEEWKKRERVACVLVGSGVNK